MSFLSAGTTLLHRGLNFDDVLAEALDSVPTYLFATSFAFDSNASPAAAVVQMPFFALRSQRVLVQYDIQLQPSDRPMTVWFRAGPLQGVDVGPPALRLVHRESDAGNGCVVLHLDTLSADPHNRLWTLVLQRQQQDRHARAAAVFGHVMIQVVGPPRELMGHADSTARNHAAGPCPA